MARMFRYGPVREIPCTLLLISFFRRLEYTREQLLEFKKQVDDKVGQGQGEEQGGGFGGFGGFGGGSSEVSLYLSIALLTFRCY